MKYLLTITLLVLATSLCSGQGFDQEMAKAGKEFHKKSKNAGKTIYKKSKGSQAKANRAKRKNKKRFKNRNPGA